MELKSEQAVIGSILTEPDCIDLVKKYIPDGSYFADAFLGKVLNTVYKMHDNGEAIDLTTVYDKMPEVVDLLARIVDALVTTAHVEEYAKLIRDYYARRKLKRIISAVDPLNTKKYNSPLDAITEIDAGVRDVEQIIQNAEETSASDLVNACLNDIERDMEQGVNRNIISTGFIDLDRLIIGFERPESVIVAARPSIGKTSFSQCLALNIAKKKIGKVLFFSLEMSKKKLMNRLFSIEGRVDSEKVRKRNLDEENYKKIIKAAETLSNLDLIIIDDAFNLSEIRSIVARHAARGEVALVVIDYLQLLREQGKRFQSRQVELGYYANEIARIAKTYNTITLTLSQLSRAVESRDDKRPRLSDLYESGAIEAAADIVLFLYRDEYYNSDSDEKGIAEVGAAKTRDGATGKCKLTWQGQYYRFDNLATGQEVYNEHFISRIFE